jgi:hypothetical protein
MSNEDPSIQRTSAPQTTITDPHAYDTEEEDVEWREEPEELPRRPRRRLLTPASGALLAVLLTAAGFVGGVLVEKGQGSSAGSVAGGGTGAGARFARLRGASGSSAGAAGLGGPAAGGATVGQVAFIQGATLYVTNTQGNTVKVTTAPGATVTKTVKADPRSIHPGETVIVTGTTGADGAISAASIRVGGSGEGGGLASLLGGSGSGSGSSSSAGASGGAEPSLFGKGG